MLKVVWLGVGSSRVVLWMLMFFLFVCLSRCFSVRVFFFVCVGVCSYLCRLLWLRF